MTTAEQGTPMGTPEHTDEALALQTIGKLHERLGRIPGRDRIKQDLRCGSDRATHLRSLYQAQHGRDLRPVNSPEQESRTPAPQTKAPGAGEQTSSPPAGEQASGRDRDKAERAARKGTFLYYVVALLSLGMSADTSLLFFEHTLGIHRDWERWMLFSVMEIMLIACAVNMRADVRHRHMDRPRITTKFTVWCLCAFSAFSASEVADGYAVEVFGRVVFGPLLGLIALHYAVGIEVRAQRSQRGAWARITFELRERVLSRLGLGNDQRDALARTRDRAARRAARLAVRRSWFNVGRQRRLEKALRAANVAHDPAMRDTLMNELAMLRNAHSLGTVPVAAPWPTTEPPNAELIPRLLRPGSDQ